MGINAHRFADLWSRMHREVLVRFEEGLSE